MASLKEDLEQYVAGLRYDEQPSVDTIPEDVEYVDDVHLGDRRWGSDQLLVVRRGDETSGIHYYSYSGDSDGPSDAEVVDVESKVVTTWTIKR